MYYKYPNLQIFTRFEVREVILGIKPLKSKVGGGSVFHPHSSNHVY